jgi:hypothetical protein
VLLMPYNADKIHWRLLAVVNPAALKGLMGGESEEESKDTEVGGREQMDLVSEEETEGEAGASAEGGVAGTTAEAADATDSTSQVSFLERTGEYGTHPIAHVVSLTALSSLLHSQVSGSAAAMAVDAEGGASTEGGVVGKASETVSHAMDVDVTTPATIKSGVEVKESLLEDAGRGLFAQRKFARRDLITKYAGKKLEDKFAAAQCYPQTHIVHMSTAFNKEIGNDVYIDGDCEPVEGSGGGSFANHMKFKKDCNAEFALVDGDVFLRATHEIEEGEEIYVHCGTDLHVMMGLKKRIVTTDVNGDRSIDTVPVVDLEAPTRAWKAARAAWEAAVDAVRQAQADLDARDTTLSKRSKELRQREAKAAFQTEGTANAVKLNAECRALREDVEDARQRSEKARAALEMRRAEEESLNDALDAALLELNEVDARRRGKPKKWRELQECGGTTLRNLKLNVPTASTVDDQTAFESIFNGGFDEKGVPIPCPPGVGDRWHGRKAVGKVNARGGKNTRGGKKAADQPDAPWVEPTEESVLETFGAAGLDWFSTTTGDDSKRVVGTHALKAGVDSDNNNATTPEQTPLHADSCWPNSHVAARAPWGDAHLVMIVALQDGTELPIYPFDKDGERETVKLNKGDVFVGRGDVIHVGARYEKLNIRIHFYIDSPCAREPRNPNDTYQVHGNVKDYWPIERL